MNLLCGTLPQYAVIDGQRVPLHTGWRTAVRILCAFEDAALTPAEKQLLLLSLLYGTPPKNTAAALQAGIRFLNGGLPGGDGKGVRLYSFQHDAPYIYAAVQKSHGIDLLASPQLHWHCFLSLFMDLQEDCLFVRMVYLRRQYAAGRLTKEEQHAYAQMRHILTLPVPQDAETQAFMAALGKTDTP